MTRNERFMQRAIELASESVKQGGGPFGCIIVKSGKIISEGKNQVTKKHDPTHHAEIAAIRQACKTLKSHQLTGCTVYTSSFPCPMCLAALHWARPKQIFYASTTSDVERAGFDDGQIKKELTTSRRHSILTTRLRVTGANAPLKQWKASETKTPY